MEVFATDPEGAERERRWPMLLLGGGNALAAAAALVVGHGFAGCRGSAMVRLLMGLAAGGFVVELALRWREAGFGWDFLREEAAAALPTALLPGALLTTLITSPGWISGVVEAYLGVMLLGQVIRLYRAAHRARFGPAHLLVISWLVAIAVGTGLLLLPRATASGRGAPLSTALFTATSAVCVTGLIVEDTGSYWSRGGQLVILVLIQLGGVGLMTFAALFALLLRRGLALRERVVLREVFSEEVALRTGRLVGGIAAVTVGFEAVGALLLYGLWDPQVVSSPGGRLYYSIFHAVSAFCNAGFSLFPTSFVRYADRWQVPVVMAGLIVAGGLGFPVLVNLWEVLTGRLRCWLSGGTGEGVPTRLSLQSALVITTSAVLLLVGTGLFLVLERGATLSGLSAGAALRRAFFQSVTARTAGFNTVDIAQVSLPAACVLMGLMFIGASPGSTGGGVKTSTIAVLLANLWATLRRRQRVEVLRRTIPTETVTRAMAVVTVAVLVVAGLVLMLTITERGRGFRFEDICFEAFSAFGTVGLSRGITPHLSTAGRLVITAGMFVGRIGPLTLAVALYGKRRPGRYEYPEEPIMIG